TLLHLHQGLSRAICGWQVALGRNGALPVPRRHGLPGSLVNGLDQPDLEVAEHFGHLLPGAERPTQRILKVPLVGWGIAEPSIMIRPAPCVLSRCHLTPPIVLVAASASGSYD